MFTWLAAAFLTQKWIGHMTSSNQASTARRNELIAVNLQRSCGSRATRRPGKGTHKKKRKRASNGPTNQPKAQRGEATDRQTDNRCCFTSHIAGLAALPLPPPSPPVRFCVERVRYLLD